MDKILLIVPVGIEIKSLKLPLNRFYSLLIVPVGIEIEKLKNSGQLNETFNRTSRN